MRRLLLSALLLLLVVPATAGAMASHRGWPPYDGMLLMNEADRHRPLDARPGALVFGGPRARQGCKDTSDKPSSSCKHWMRHSAQGHVATETDAHHRLYGGHGNDRIHAGPNGDVIWGDYKPSGQPTSQRDRLHGGASTDFIYASHGKNWITGGAGDDVIHAHFGRGKIDCGPGRDIVYVHGGKRSAYTRKNCEVVSRKTGESAPKWILRGLPWPVTNTQERE